MAEENGPMKPGYGFYELLSHCPGLKVPIPDTFVIEADARISHLCNDKNGNIRRIPPSESSLEWKEEFVTQFVNKCVTAELFFTFPIKSFFYRCLEGSVPVGISNDRHANSIAERPVAMLKRPAWRKTIRNSSETLSPLALQAHMLDSLGEK